jgi:hypothetical protein
MIATLVLQALYRSLPLLTGGSATHVLTGTLRRALGSIARKAKVDCLWAVWFASSLPVRPMSSACRPPSFVLALGSTGCNRRCHVAVTRCTIPLFLVTLLLPAGRHSLLLPQPGIIPRLLVGRRRRSSVVPGRVFGLVGHFTRPYPFLRFLLRALSMAGVIAGALALALLIWGQGPSGGTLALEWSSIGAFCPLPVSVH